MTLNYGLGTLIAEFDVQEAYCNIDVHPSDRYGVSTIMAI